MYRSLGTGLERIQGTDARDKNKKTYNQKYCIFNLVFSFSIPRRFYLFQFFCVKISPDEASKSFWCLVHATIDTIRQLRLNDSKYLVHQLVKKSSTFLRTSNCLKCSVLFPLIFNSVNKIFLSLTEDCTFSTFLCLSVEFSLNKKYIGIMEGSARPSSFVYLKPYHVTWEAKIQIYQKYMQQIHQ